MLDFSHDLKFALKGIMRSTYKDLRAFKNSIINATEYRSYLQRNDLIQSENDQTSLDFEAAGYEFEQLQSSIKRSALSQALYLASKLLRNQTNGIFVQQSGIKNLKSLIEQSGKKVVLVPQYRS